MFFGILTCLTQVVLKPGDLFRPATKFERVSIPSAVMCAMFDYMYPEDCQSSKEELERAKMEWFTSLAAQGYTVARFGASGDAIIAEATKEPLKW